MKTVIDGIQLNYERRGEGSPVLLLHGWGANIAAMKPIADCVISLGYEAVSLDFPGFGESPEPPAAWGVPEYAKVTRAFIEEQGIRGCDVICHSFGGRVTILLASEDEKLFNRLVLVDAAGVRPKRGLRYYIRTYKYKLGKHLKKIKLFDRMFRLSKRQKNAGSEDYRALSDSMKGTFVRVVNLDLAPKLKEIKNETLIIWGENDTDTPMYMAERMERDIKNSGLAVLPGAGHFSYVDQYPRFCSILKALMEVR
ncbi:MAG: alpha/beta hydrolase [Clostridia bacterium]|nr:alpha/beta hydrolase [Clostridia bacterium]